jgi:DNA polymerase III subunit alpha
MRAAVDIAGYTNSEADDLRKAIAKKDQEKLLKHHAKFVGGAVKRGVMPEENANQIFEDWLEFARYGFNRSHAAVYGVLAVQTAYLKAHYPIEYMTANLSAYKANTDRVALYVADCRRMGIEVLPPDVNTSGWDFTIEDRDDKTSRIRFGLGAVKNVGHGPVNAIIEARKESGPFDGAQEKSFKDLSEFARRVDLRSVGKRALESLVKVGAMDSFGSRPAQLEAVDRIIAISASHFKAAEVGQLSMFSAQTGLVTHITLPKTAAADRKEILTWEKELIGLYVSDHPLTPYIETLSRAVSHYSADLKDANHGDKVRVAGLVTHVRPYTTKSGKPMGFVSLQDLQGTIELILFAKTWEKCRELIELEKVLLAEGTIDAQGADPKILVDNIRTEFTYLDSLDTTPEQSPKAVPLRAESRPTRPAPQPRRESALTTPGSRATTGQPPHAPRSSTPVQQISDPPGEYTTSDDKDEWDPTVPMPDFPSWDEKFAPRGPSSNSLVPSLPDYPIAESEPVYAASATSATRPKTQEIVKPAAQSEIQNSEFEIDNSQFTIHNPSSSLRTNLQSVIPNLSSPLPVPSYLLSPRPGEDPDIPRRMVTITLRANHDKIRDALKIQRIYGVFVSYPGYDRFALYLFEGNRSFLIEFPNFTTQISDEMLQRLYEFVPREGVRIEPIIYH